MDVQELNLDLWAKEIFLICFLFMQEGTFQVLSRPVTVFYISVKCEEHRRSSKERESLQKKNEGM